MPANVQCYDFIQFENFVSYLKTSEIYLQPSVSEGFPNALGEAMSYECLPIGSKVGGIPDMIGDTGFLLTNINDDQILKDFDQAVKLSSEERNHYGMLARKRIKEYFNLDLRKEQFLKVLSDHK